MLAGMWKRELCTLLVAMQISTAFVEKRMEIPQQARDRNSSWSSIPTTRYFLKEMKSVCYKAIFTIMFIASLISQGRRNINNISVHQMMTGNKKMCIYQVEYFSAFGKDRILPFAATYVIMWSERTKYRKISSTGSHSYVESKTKLSQKGRVYWWLPEVRESKQEWDEEAWLMSTKLLLERSKTFCCSMTLFGDCR